MSESARVHIHVFGDTAVKALIRLLSKGLPFFWFRVSDCTNQHTGFPCYFAKQRNIDLNLR